MATVKAIVYDSHHFHSHQGIINKIMYEKQYFAAVRLLLPAYISVASLRTKSSNKYCLLIHSFTNYKWLFI